MPEKPQRQAVWFGALAFKQGTSPETVAALSDGPHTFEVRATDAAGNQDLTPAERTFTVDTAVDPPVGTARIGQVKVKGPGKVKANFKVTSRNAGGKTVKQKIRVR